MMTNNTNTRFPWLNRPSGGGASQEFSMREFAALLAQARQPAGTLGKMPYTTQARGVTGNQDQNNGAPLPTGDGGGMIGPTPPTPGYTGPYTGGDEMGPIEPPFLAGAGDGPMIVPGGGITINPGADTPTPVPNQGGGAIDNFGGMGSWIGYYGGQPYGVDPGGNLYPIQRAQPVNGADPGTGGSEGGMPAMAPLPQGSVDIAMLRHLQR